MSDLFEAAGSLRHVYRRVNWASTPLGPLASWSPALPAAVRLTAQTRSEVTLLWGPQFVLLHNEAYVPVLADRHPEALGRPAQEIFREIWQSIGPMLGQVLDGEGTVWLEDLKLLMQRHACASAAADAVRR